MRSLLLVLSALAVSLLASTPVIAQQVGWSQRLVSGPPGRDGHAMVYDASRGVTVLFGGYNSNGLPLGDTWEWDGAVWTQRLVSGPPSRGYHAMAYDAARQVTVLFGGYGGYVYPNEIIYGDTWEWNGTEWTQRLVSGPEPRQGHAMAYDAARNVTVLFGGDAFTYSGNLLGDTWEWNGFAWTHRPVGGGAGNRKHHAMVYDSDRGVITLVGGQNEVLQAFYGDTWERSGATWTQRALAGPPGRAKHAMVYDSDRNITVAFGGMIPGNVVVGETWEWDGSAWVFQAITGPSPRGNHAMAYDSARGVAILFGGYTNIGGGDTGNGETWELRTLCNAPAINTQPTDQAAGVDVPVSFFVEVADTSACPVPVTFQWQRRNPAIADPDAPGAWADLADGGGYVNTRTAALLISRPTPALATGYRCRVGGGCACESGPNAFTYSNVVNFAVACPADFNGDGGIDGADVEAFFARWVDGC